MEPIQLSRENRVERRTISEQMQTIEKRYMALAQEECKLLKERQSELYAEDVQFRILAEEFIKTLKPGTMLHVRTQWGPNGGENIAEHQDAEFVHANYKGGLFNVRTKERGEFTIGTSCLQYISLADQDK